MSKLKYRFVVHYQDKHVKEVSDFLSRCDLGIDGFAFKEVFTFDYSKEEKPISYFKDLFTKAFDQLGRTIIHIEGGKIE